jgi:hypothetical protein
MLSAIPRTFVEAIAQREAQRAENFASKLLLKLMLDLLARQVESNEAGTRRSKRVGDEIIDLQAEFCWQEEEATWFRWRQLFSIPCRHTSEAAEH